VFWASIFYKRANVKVGIRKKLLTIILLKGVPYPERVPNAAVLLR
jgi:hypothetical protein